MFTKMASSSEVQTTAGFHFFFFGSSIGLIAPQE
jgi:hypothetical protein